MLSNTATPKYYGMFREAVLRGEIVINREIEMEMNRIDALIDDPGVYYDDRKVEGYIRFCNNELTLTDGSDLELLDSFKLWAEQIFGWWYFEQRSIWVPTNGDVPGHYETKLVKKRLTNKQILIVARGAAKSMYASTIQNYGLNIDTDTTDQVVTAPTMRQADEILSPIRTAIVRARGPYFQFLTDGSNKNTTGSFANRQKLFSSKKGIENTLTGSIIEVRPMSIDKLQGLRCKYASIDEWLSGDTREDPIGAIEQGASKAMMEYLILATSSEGTVRNGPGDDLKMEIMKILRGEYVNPRISIWYYKLDDIKEVADPNMWIKANPNLGITVGYDVYQEDVNKAEHNPSQRNDILAKRFGIPLEGYTYFFTYQETLPHPRAYFQRMACSLGIDLSQGDDFCAFLFFFPLGNGAFGIDAHCYISDYTYANLPMAAREKYDQFIAEGSLVVMPGTVLDMMAVYDDLEMYYTAPEQLYDIGAVGYDPYNAKEFIERYARENSPFGVEMVRQGSRTESVPLGELKHLAEQRLLIFWQEIMKFAMGNAITVEDTNGNRKLLKKRYENKIDPVSAMMDAYVAYKLHSDSFE